MMEKTYYQHRDTINWHWHLKKFDCSISNEERLIIWQENIAKNLEIFCTFFQNENLLKINEIKFDYAQSINTNANTLIQYIDNYCTKKIDNLQNIDFEIVGRGICYLPTEKLIDLDLFRIGFSFYDMEISVSTKSSIWLPFDYQGYLTDTWHTEVCDLNRFRLQAILKKINHFLETIGYEVYPHPNEEEIYENVVFYDFLLWYPEKWLLSEFYALKDKAGIDIDKYQLSYYQKRE